MKIIPIDDIEFRRRLMRTFFKKDNPRRYEIHFTDLPGCLVCAFVWKIEKREYSEKDYTSILTWNRGLAFDSVMTGKMGGKVVTRVGVAQGNVDMVMDGIPYELTSSLYSPVNGEGELNKYLKEVKVHQLEMYLAGLVKRHGRLKVVQLFCVWCLDCEKEVRKGESHKGHDVVRGPHEWTWDIFLRKRELSKARIELIERRDALVEALRTGMWRKIPREFRDRECDSREWLKAHSMEAYKLWGRWVMMAEEYDSEILAS